ncbi:MAG TPA: hypothetical protein PLD62_05835, partial [Candidatus Cloacimonadota bacterium]|nr:hypothetical protein [Candidatus Cloacimonadota bacterium]
IHSATGGQIFNLKSSIINPSFSSFIIGHSVLFGWIFRRFRTDGAKSCDLLLSPGANAPGYLISPRCG